MKVGEKGKKIEMVHVRGVITNHCQNSANYNYKLSNSEADNGLLRKLHDNFTVTYSKCIAVWP